MARKVGKPTFVVTPIQCEEDQATPGYAFKNGDLARQFCIQTTKAADRIFRKLTNQAKDAEIAVGVGFDILMIPEGKTAEDALLYGQYPVQEEDEDESETEDEE